MSQSIPLYSGAIPYDSQGQTPALTLFPLEGQQRMVLICPGGGYEHLAAHEGAPVAEALNRQGLSAAVLTYRLKPRHHAAPLMDAQRAIRLLRSMGFGPVAILGFSAGGNLACNAAVHGDDGHPGSADPVERFSCRPDALISCYSVVTLGQYTHEGSRTNLLGDAAEDEALRRFYSADTQVDDHTPPAFIWHTAEDGFVPPQNSLLLAQAMADHHRPFTLHIYPHGPHGIGLAEAYPEAAHWLADAAAWFKNISN